MIAEKKLSRPQILKKKHFIRIKMKLTSIERHSMTSTNGSNFNFSESNFHYVKKTTSYQCLHSMFQWEVSLFPLPSPSSEINRKSTHTTATMLTHGCYWIIHNKMLKKLESVDLLEATKNEKRTSLCDDVFHQRYERKVQQRRFAAHFRAFNEILSEKIEKPRT